MTARLDLSMTKCPTSPDMTLALPTLFLRMKGDLRNNLANKNTQIFREEAIFAQQKVIDDANEYFEELKKDAEEKKEEREAAWAEQELSAKEKEEKRMERKRKREAKAAKEAAAAAGVPVVDPSSYG